MIIEVQRELQRNAASLAYQAIRFSGLWRELTGAEWDTLAEKLGEWLVYRLNGWVDAELTRIEEEKEQR